MYTYIYIHIIYNIYIVYIYSIYIIIYNNIYIYDHVEIDTTRPLDSYWGGPFEMRSLNYNMPKTRPQDAQAHATKLLTCAAKWVHCQLK